MHAEAYLRPARRGFAQAGATARKRGNLTGLLHFVRNEATLWQLICDAHLL
jgi:hypothetical protein